MSDECKDALAGLSHDLYQPLNSMKIICQSILRNLDRGICDTEHLSDELREVIRQIDRIDGLIHKRRLSGNGNRES